MRPLIVINKEGQKISSTLTKDNPLYTSKITDTMKKLSDSGVIRIVEIPKSELESQGQGNSSDSGMISESLTINKNESVTRERANPIPENKKSEEVQTDEGKNSDNVVDETATSSEETKTTPKRGRKKKTEEVAADEAVND